MSNINNRAIFNSIVAIAGTYFTWLFGSWDLALQVLVTFMVLDYVTGVITGYINKEIDSKVGFKGILRKALILIVLIVGVLLDRLIGQGWIFRTLVCYFFIANEGISILENIGKCGIPLPKALIEKLNQLKDYNENKGE